jgi:hypothetical protein
MSSIVQSIRGKDQLIFNGFRYRQDRLLVRRCIKDNRKGRARLDGVNYEIDKDHICQVMNTNTTEKVLHTHETREKAEESDDPRD